MPCVSFLLMLRLQFLLWTYGFFVRNCEAVEVNLHIWHSVTSLHKTAGWEWGSCQRVEVRLKWEKAGCAHKTEHFNRHFPANLAAEQQMRIMVMLLEEMKRKRSEVKCLRMWFFSVNTWLELWSLKHFHLNVTPAFSWRHSSTCGNTNMCWINSNFNSYVNRKDSQICLPFSKNTYF